MAIQREERILMTVPELMEYLSLARQTIYQLVNKREIPFKKPTGKLWFDKQEIDDWIDASSVLTNNQVEQAAIKRSGQDGH